MTNHESLLLGAKLQSLWCPSMSLVCQIRIWRFLGFRLQLGHKCLKLAQNRKSTWCEEKQALAMSQNSELLHVVEVMAPKTSPTNLLWWSMSYIKRSSSMLHLRICTWLAVPPCSAKPPPEIWRSFWRCHEDRAWRVAFLKIWIRTNNGI